MTKAKEATLTVEKNEQVAEETKNPRINPEVIEKLKGEIKAKEEELETKKYLIPGGKQVAKNFKQFIAKNAKWRFTEAIGVVEVNRILIEFIENPAETELMIPAVALEAMYYFMARHEGTGLVEAKEFTDLIKAINSAKGRSEQDRKEFEEMTFRLQSLEHGVDPDSPEDTFKNTEIEVEA
jgi:hypothetical protein